MKIAVLNLTGGGISGGYKKYLKNMIPRMSAQPGVERLLCVSPAPLKMQDFIGSYPKVQYEACRPYSLLRGFSDSILKKILEKFSPDVIFIPMERYFKFKEVPVVNMIQNMWPLISLRHAEFREKARTFVQRVVAREAVRRAGKVIAVSDYVKDYLKRQWHIPEKRVQIIYHGIDKPNGGDMRRPSGMPSQWDKFLFTAGSIDPYRGLEDIFGALHILKSKDLNYPFVIAGEARPAMKSYFVKLRKFVKRNGLEERVCWAGSLTESEMAWCYNFCAAMVISSRVEACPNIALEAMACGCPTLAAENPPLPEFFKDTAIYYAPGKADALVSGIQRVLNMDAGKRQTMSEKLKMRAADFSWDVTAEKTVAELIKSAKKNENIVRQPIFLAGEFSH